MEKTMQRSIFRPGSPIAGVGTSPFRIAQWTCTGLLTLTLFGCKHEETAPPPQQSPEVGVMIVQPESIRLLSELPGRTNPFLVAEIRPQVSGIIQKRLFEEGSEVEEGQTLYQIDPAPFQAALNSAKAALASAESGLQSIKLRVERYEELLKDRAVSQQDYDDALAGRMQAEAAILVAEAAVQTAEINLGYTAVRAPISGRIGKSSVTDGALVTAFQPLPLATIQQLDPIYVDVPQSATERLNLRRHIEEGRLLVDDQGQSVVELVLSDGSPYSLKGVLQFQDVSVDPSTGSVILRAVFPNPDKLLLPGMFVRAAVVEGVQEAAILLPQQCVLRDPKGDPYALLVDAENTIRQQFLSIDRAIGNRWLISSGLNPGDHVVIEGLQRARPGSPVRVTPIDPAAPAAPSPAQS
jgi:membrane fusion protein (multidrug efflux system)